MKYKYHPKYKNVKISEDGKTVLKNGVECSIRVSYPKPNNPLMTVRLYGSTYLSLPKLVNETWNGLPPKDKRYCTECLDGNFENTHPNNLIWVRVLTRRITPIDFYKTHTKQSKLTEEQSIYCYNAHKVHGVKLLALAVEFNVSDMAIHRAIKRVERLRNSE